MGKRTVVVMTNAEGMRREIVGATCTGWCACDSLEAIYRFAVAERDTQKRNYRHPYRAA